MEQGFIDVLQKLVNEQGNGALTDARKCKALISDYTGGEYKKESRFVVQAVEAGAAKAIEGASDLATCKKAQVRELEEEFGLSPAVAADIVDTLALVLRGKTTATSASPPPAAPVAAPAGTPITGNKGTNKLIRTAAIVAIGIWCVTLIILVLLWHPYFRFLVEIILRSGLPFSLPLLLISIVISSLSWKKNNRTMVLIAGIIYIVGFYGIPSGILCIIAFRKMKKPVG